jgi:hypothetical protein
MTQEAFDETAKTKLTDIKDEEGKVTGQQSHESLYAKIDVKGVAQGKT